MPRDAREICFGKWVAYYWIMLTNKVEALTRLRELLIKQNECKAKTYRIEKRVDGLVQESEHADPDQRAEIFLEMEKNHACVKQILAELEANQPEMDRLIEILGDDVVLEEISKHPLTFSVSVN